MGIQIQHFLALLLVALLLIACGTNKRATYPIGSLQTDSLSILNVKPKPRPRAQKKAYFVHNKVAKPLSQKFLTNSAHSDEHPIWSPNGKYIAFQRGNPSLGIVYNIWLMNADGSNQKKITNCPFDCQQPSWSSDGKKMAFRKATGELDSLGNRYFDLYQIDLESNLVTPLLLSKQKIEKHPSYSPNNQFIVFSAAQNGQADLFVLNLDSLKVQPNQITNSPLRKDVHPNFSNNGKTILFHSYALDKGTRLNDSSEMQYPTRLGISSAFDKATPQWINLNDSIVFPKHPFYTLNDKLITFHARDSATFKRNVFVIHLNALVAVQITKIKNAKHPQLSPNGKYLIYAHKRRLKLGLPKQYDISIVRINYPRLLRLAMIR